MDQIGIERLKRLLQPCGGIDHTLQCYALLMKRRILASDMVINQFREISAEIVVGNCLKGREIGMNLVQTPTEPLTVLSDEARDARCEQYRRQQYDSIEDATHDMHGPILLRARPRGEIQPHPPRMPALWSDALHQGRSPAEPPLDFSPQGNPHPHAENKLGGEID